jgi:ATP-binding cassette subfamily F protein uup
MKAERAAARVRREKKGDTRKSKDKQRKLTWKEQKELAALPDRIHESEAELARLDEEMSDAGFFEKPSSVARTKRRSELAEELAKLYARWERLEALK